MVWSLRKGRPRNCRISHLYSSSSLTSLLAGRSGQLQSGKSGYSTAGRSSSNRRWRSGWRRRNVRLSPGQIARRSANRPVLAALVGFFLSLRILAATTAGSALVGLLLHLVIQLLEHLLKDIRLLFGGGICGTIWLALWAHGIDLVLIGEFVKQCCWVSCSGIR